MDLVNAMIRFSRFDEFFESEEVDAHTSTHRQTLFHTHTYIHISIIIHSPDNVHTAVAAATTTAEAAARIHVV